MIETTRLKLIPATVALARAEIGDRREIANALFNRSYADLIEVMSGTYGDRTLAALRAQDRREVYVPAGQVPAPPMGRWRHLPHFQPVQHDFPETYGIGAAGLPQTAAPDRVAKARTELVSYLDGSSQDLSSTVIQATDAAAPAAVIVARS